ncbi:MAG TPA: SCO family protein [Methyloceanibacter sp.]|nr:SCO family protein [Methyloceanibacter sp.]
MSGRLLTIVVAGFLVGAIAGAGALVLMQGPQVPRAVITTGKAAIGGPFSLIDQNGKAVTDRDFRGRYMLVFFGFTHCPDICPTELQVMSSALEALGGKAEKVAPIFITLDPERDTPQVVGNYVKNFGPNFVGLTGSPEAVAQAAKAYRVAYSKVEQNGDKDYTVDHSTFIYLMGPDGEFITFFSYGTPPEKIADTLKSYL